jgi:O-antigen/teichoic acid export membrane protein
MEKLSLQSVELTEGLTTGSTANIGVAAAGRSSHGQLVSWIGKGGFAVLDQGFVSGSNFLVGIFLARWMPAEQYGAYAVGFAVYLLAVVLYQSLLLEPMLVFGPSKYANCVRGYLRSLLSLHWIIALGMSLPLLVCAAIFFSQDHASGLAAALTGAGVAMPVVLLFWLARRVFYIRNSPAGSAAGAVLYSIATLGSLMGARHFGLISPLSALLVMGIGALAAGAALLIFLALYLPQGGGRPAVGETWRQHWGYGGWALAAAAMIWIPSNIFYPLVSKFCGSAQAGAFKALMNFTLPLFQVCAALSSLALPYAARRHNWHGVTNAGVLSRRIALLFTGGAVIYWCLVLLLRHSAFRVLYSGRYTEMEHLLWVIAIGSIFWSAFMGPATTLRAMESPALVLVAATVAGCVTLAIGIPATKYAGIGGAAWAWTVAEAVAFATAEFLVRGKVRKAIPVMQSAELPVAS